MCRSIRNYRYFVPVRHHGGGRECGGRAAVEEEEERRHENPHPSRYLLHYINFRQI